MPTIFLPPFAGPSPAFFRRMRPLPLTRSMLRANISSSRLVLATSLLPILVAMALTHGCGSVTTSSPAPPPPNPTPTPTPPASVSVTISPNSASVLLGNTQAFSATVANASDATVTWSVNGVPGGNATTGLITTAGLYSAPADLPSVTAIQITATSNADPTKSAAAAVTITSDIAVSLSPGASNVILGASQVFHASISSTGHPDITVRWSLSGSACPASCGALDASGNYTAPTILPTLTTATISAQSVADPAKQASATVTIVSDIAVALTPSPAAVELGALQAFHASISSAGHPNTSVRWSLSGVSCPAACGSLDSSGNYTAPPILPNPASVSITAQSIADPAKQTAAAVTITSNFTLQIAAPSSLTSGGSATIAATLTPVLGSNPSTILSWSLSGAGCSGAACGTLVVVTTQPLGGGATSVSANYTAPVTPPSPNTVTISVTPQADPTKRVQVAIAIQTGVGVTLSPGTATLSGLHRVSLTAQVFGSSNLAVTWTVNGVRNGNGTVGQICIVASTPCQPLPTGNNAQVDYQAPGAIPIPNPVTVQATSAADTTRSATAQITVINHDVVSVFPASVTLAPLSVQAFSATVLGTSNQAVVWQLQGAACSVASACGSIDSNGVYAAPGAAPSPDSISVVAISSDDPSQSGSANVTISTGAAILALHPASVYAGGASGFTLRVDGSNFVATTSSTGSVMLVGGTARTTTCTSVTECTAPVAPADVASVGSLPIQIRNPDNSTSNAVALVIAAQNATDASIPLTSAAPSATAQDIVVVEPTTAGVSTPSSDVDLNVAALGLFSVANNSCSLAGNPIALARPASGTAAVDVCLFSAGGLDSSMTYTVTGPGDISVIAKQPAGLGIIHLTLQISATALTGARSLFIQNTNFDKTAATAALEVQ